MRFGHFIHIDISMTMNEGDERSSQIKTNDYIKLSNRRDA